MVYRTRSKYTPGGGVLAFFEQVSRFVSLSVAIWIGVSLFFVLFVADGKITDSLDLRLFRGLFSEWRLFWTSLMLVGLSGLMGVLISLPASFLLLLSRQYLDFQLMRSSRRGNFFRVQLIKYLPSVVLIFSHVAVFSLNIISAPQLTRPWLKEGSRVSELLAGGHFVLSSLTRRAAVAADSEDKNRAAGSQGTAQGAPQQMHIILIPAEQMESEEFLLEQAKLPDAVRVPFVIPKSSVFEQLDTLLESTHGRTPELARKILLRPRDYTKLVSDGKAQVVVSVSPQIRFGNQLVGYGTENLGDFNESLLVQEAQRRLALSQIHLFGLFRAFDGVPFGGSGLSWINLVADDVIRLRKNAALATGLNQNVNSLVIVQLAGMEKEFRSVRSPFRPSGWMLTKASYESRIVNKNLVRELIQYLHDVGARDKASWMILPYADDQRTNPRSFALISSRSDLAQNIRQSSGVEIGFLGADIARELSRHFEENPSAIKGPATVANALPSTASVTPTGERLSCVETEVDFADAGFKFQPVDLRERSLGQLLNSLPAMPDSDLAVLGKSMSSLVSRELGLGFLCRTWNQSIEEVYLLKYKGIYGWSGASKGLRQGGSVLLNRASQQSAGELGRGTRARSTVASVAQVPASVQKIQTEVLEEFVVLHLVPEQSEGRDAAVWSWRRLDSRESQYFFSKFQTDALHAIELSARARIR
ncbi:MAG: hypothetical protein RI932_614 [Pseudomonadota bacterium]